MASGTSLDQPTRSGNDPSQQVHTTATLPNSYPPQPNAKVHIAWGVIVKLNSPGTSTISDSFFCDTTLTNYVTDVPAKVQNVYSYFSSQIALGADVEIHWAIKLDNPTAPPPPAGAYVQAKQHLDGHLSTGNIKTIADIQDPVMQAIPFLQQIAKY